jgi:hypothetical protein
MHEQRDVQLGIRRLAQVAADCRSVKDPLVSPRSRLSVTSIGVNVAWSWIEGPARPLVEDCAQRTTGSQWMAF